MPNRNPSLCHLWKKKTRDWAHKREEPKISLSRFQFLLSRATDLLEKISVKKLIHSQIPREMKSEIESRNASRRN